MIANSYKNHYLYHIRYFVCWDIQVSSYSPVITTRAVPLRRLQEGQVSGDPHYVNFVSNLKLKTHSRFLFRQMSIIIFVS